MARRGGWPPLLLLLLLLAVWASSTSADSRGVRRSGRPPPSCEDHCPGQECRVSRRQGRVFCLGGLLRLNDDDDGGRPGRRRCRCRTKKGKRCRRRRSRSASGSRSRSKSRGRSQSKSKKSKSKSRSRSRSKSPCVCFCDRVMVKNQQPVRPEIVKASRLQSAPVSGPHPHPQPDRIYRSQVQSLHRPLLPRKPQQQQQQGYPGRPARLGLRLDPAILRHLSKLYGGVSYRTLTPESPVPPYRVAAPGGPSDRLVHGPASQPRLQPRRLTCSDICHGKPCVMTSSGQPSCVGGAERGRPRNRCRCSRRRSGSSSGSSSDSGSGSRSRSGGRERCRCKNRKRSRSDSR